MDLVITRRAAECARDRRRQRADREGAQCLRCSCAEALGALEGAGNASKSLMEGFHNVPLFLQELLNVPEIDGGGVLGARARSASDAAVLRRKGHLKEQDRLIEFLLSMHHTHTSLEAMQKMERWITEHRQVSMHLILSTTISLQVLYIVTEAYCRMHACTILNIITLPGSSTQCMGLHDEGSGQNRRKISSGILSAAGPQAQPAEADGA